MNGSDATGPLDAIQLVTVEEAATALRVSKMTVYRMAAEDEIEAIRVRGAIRIPLAAVTEYMAAHRNGQAPGDAA